MGIVLRGETMAKFVSRVPAALAAAVLGIAAVVGLAGPAAAAAPVADRLTGVACLSAKNCVAVGADQNKPAPLAEVWNGAAWHKTAVSLPVKGSIGTLDSVACPAVKFGVHCVAVGGFLVATESAFSLIATWNGKAWTSKQAPGPVGTRLAAVSCPTVNDCVAVGDFVSNPNAGISVPFSVVWNGHSWSRVKIPAPAGGGFSNLFGVSCGSATFCVAVGQDSPAKGNPRVLIERWNGHAWSIMKAPPLGTFNDPIPESVSCPSAKSCLLVGSGTTAKGLAVFAEAWNGAVWSVTSAVPWPKGTKNPWLNGVSCAAPGRCVADGYVNFNPIDGGTTGRAAAATWNGKAWKVTAVAAPAKGKASQFNGVYCIPEKATFCAAVGILSPFNSLNGVGLSGFFNGTTWKLVAAV
jgi:hypothetical protein